MVRLGALAALSTLLLGGCWPPCDDTSYDTRDNLYVREDDPGEATVIQACFDNDFNCDRLCSDLLGPPPYQSYRTIIECVVNRDGAGGLNVMAHARVVEKCVDDWGTGDDTTWTPTVDAAGWPYPDGWREQVDASPPDAAVYDATPGL